MKSSDIIPELIEKLKNSDVSIRKISKILGIPEQRMYGWTNKGATPSHEDVEKLKNYFGYVPHGNELNDDGIELKKGKGTDYYEQKYIGILNDRIEELKADKEWLKKTLEVSLNGIAIGQKSILAHLATGLEQDALRDAAGDEKKAARLMKQTDKRIADKLQVSLRRGIAVDR